MTPRVILPQGMVVVKGMSLYVFEVHVSKLALVLLETG